MNPNNALHITITAAWLVSVAIGPKFSQASSSAMGVATSINTPQIADKALATDLRTWVETVYTTLVGGMAAQRGDYLQAGQYYGEAAKLQQHSGLAELATLAALAAKDYTQAKIRLAYWLHLEPNNTAALHIAVLLAIEQNDREQILLNLQRLVAIKTTTGSHGYAEAVELLEHIKDITTRLDLGRRLMQEHMDDANALFALATLETGAENYAAAEDLIHKVMQQRPDWNEARILLVRILKSRNDTVGARTALEKFLITDPQNKKLRGIYARLLLELNMLPEAKVQFARLYADDPKDGDSLFALGVLTIQLKQHADSVKYLEQLYNFEDYKDNAAFFLGQLFEDTDKSDEALRWYSRVEGGNKVDSQARIARIYAKQGAILRAREVVQQLRGQESKDEVQLDLLEADILREAKEYKAAFAVLEQALQKKPDNHELLYFQAITAVYLERVDLVEQNLKYIIQNNPNHAEALNALGYTLADRTARHKEALDYIQRALALKPNSAAILDSMGWVHYRLGDMDKAITYLTQAIKILQDPEIAAHLGEVLWKTGKQQQARQVWQDALKKSPASEFILKIQQRYGINSK